MTEPHELPAAYAAPGRIAPPSALDQPAVGLVLVMAALLALPQSMIAFIQTSFLGDAVDGSLLFVSGAMVVSGLLQLAAGVAVAWQWRYRMPAFTAALASGGTVVLVTLLMWPHEMAVREAIAAFLETIGSPLLVVLAPRVFGLTRITRHHAIGGVLIVSATSTLIFQSVNAAVDARMLVHSLDSGGAWFEIGFELALPVAIAVLGLLAGLCMVRGQPARRWLGAYVIASLAGSGGRQLLAIGFGLFSRDPYPTFVLATLAIGLGMAIATPLIVWRFAQEEREPAARVDGALPWIALWFVPQLAARCLLGEQMADRLGGFAWPLVVLCAAQAIACLVAARASLLGHEAKLAWRIAAGIAGALLVLALIWLFTQRDAGDTLVATRVRPMAAISPVALLFAALAIGAWLAGVRRATTSGTAS